MNIKIKGHEIAAFKPVICVPVMGKTKNQLVDQIKDCLQKGAFLIEWRADFYEHIMDKDAVCDTLRELASLDDKMILIFTIRSNKQGGEGSLATEYFEELLTAVADTGAADFIDVEFTEHANVKTLISRLQQNGSRVITSHHNFSLTPSKGEMLELLEAMTVANADIVKLAVMPNSREDVVNLLDITRQYCENHDRLAITMSMGSLGQISRVAGAAFGSCVTFASVAEASAPGQLSFAEASDIINILGR